MARGRFTTREELEELIGLFEDQIEVVVARAADRMVLGGVVLFKIGPVVHAQYIASSPEGMQANALDAVFDECIESGGRRRGSLLRFRHQQHRRGTDPQRRELRVQARLSEAVGSPMSGMSSRLDRRAEARPPRARS